MRRVVLLCVLLLSCVASARIEVLFHPHDPTLEKIATWISEQTSGSVDIAMYNMEMGNDSPVMRALRSSLVQERIQKGDLRIRLIFEGYEKPAKRALRLAQLEEIGLDARTFAKSAKVHHKFAVFSSGRVVTGSANWSLSSASGYNENILFSEDEPEMTARFQKEFNELWRNSNEVGLNRNFPDPPVWDFDQPDLIVHFNSWRWIEPSGEELYQPIVRALDSAKSHVEIATTRVRSVPLLEALRRTAQRGVKVRILITMGDAHDLWKRTEWLFQEPNLELRIKVFNLNFKNHLSRQMHHKFMIKDSENVLTGSYNWSFSSETLHVENLVEMRGQLAETILPLFQNEFEMLWSEGRDAYPKWLQDLEEKKRRGILPACEFGSVALTYEEVRNLQSQFSKCQE